MRALNCFALSLAVLSLALSGCSKKDAHGEEHGGNEHGAAAEHGDNKGHGDSHAPAASHGDGHGEKISHWGYVGEEGPDHWANLGGENQVCATGQRQSPIDLSGTEKRQFTKVTFDYSPSLATIQNNGHTVVVTPSNSGGVVVDGVRYHLKQFHYHTPSEHAINGRRTVLETHFVHQNDKKEFLVIGVLSEVGVADPVLASIMTYMPTDAGKAMPMADIMVNPKDMMPAAKDFYVYAGSLTTPPCSESVTWVVFSTTLNVAPEQADTIAQIMGPNSRPLQPKNDRDFIHLSGT